MSQAEADVYRSLIVAQVPRLFGLLDRDAMSPSSGCGDRTYWAWKFVDFPRSRFQEVVCVASFLYSNPLPDSECHRNPAVLEWIGAALRFWTRLQHTDGSFDEAYPFERSLAATAFTTFYVGEALAFLGADLAGDVRREVRVAMSRAGEWLVRNDETHGFLSNHLAAAAGALAHAHRETGEGRFAARSQAVIDRILDHQSSEGWYEEYGGADPGYQTHGMFYLARCLQLGGDAALRGSLLRAADFMAHFAHPDGSIGGEYASRNTQTYYPAAFEMLAPDSPSAAWMADFMRPSVSTAHAAGLPGIDSYNYFPLLNNLVFAYLATVTAPMRAAHEPSRDQRLVWFPDAGLARIRTPRYDAFVGTSKGGVLRVFDRQSRTLVDADCGYIARMRDGALVSSQYLDRRRHVQVTAEAIEVDGHFVRFSRPTMNPILFVGFRIFTLTIGRLPGVAYWLKRQLVRTLVYKQRALPVTLRRRFEFCDEGVTISDRLDGTQVFRQLRRGARFATIHMGSSRYFIANELVPITAHELISESDREPRELTRHVTIPHASRQP